MTAKVKRGLGWLTEFGRSFLEADGGQAFGETKAEERKGWSEVQAAQRWIENGGLS